MSTVPLVCVAVLGLLVFGLGLAISAARFRGTMNYVRYDRPRISSTGWFVRTAIQWSSRRFSRCCSVLRFPPALDDDSRIDHCGNHLPLFACHWVASMADDGPAEPGQVRRSARDLPMRRSIVRSIAALMQGVAGLQPTNDRFGELRRSAPGRVLPIAALRSVIVVCRSHQAAPGH
jgi:hypothetical protein